MTDWAALSARYEAEAKDAWVNLVAASHRLSDRTPVRTGSGTAIIPNQTTYAAERPTSAGPQQIIATEDGRYYDRSGWHEGDVGPIEDWVYFERWVDGRREAHGYIHPVTRRLVQSG